MQWELLNYTDFKKAVKASKGVCVLPIGIMEKHGEHMPLGIDYIKAHEVCRMAAEKESAVVFPPYYFSQISEVRHTAGTICLKPKLMYDLLENVCDEIGRNGFTKILIVNAHGGNFNFLPYFVISQLYKERPYALYLVTKTYGPLKAEWDKFIETEDNHAGEWETSAMMAIDEKSVKLKYLPKKPGLPLNRISHLGDLMTGMFWYADYPEHYAGDASRSTKEKGHKVLSILADYIAKKIKLVKNDKVVPKLLKEYFKRCEAPYKK